MLRSILSLSLLVLLVPACGGKSTPVQGPASAPAAAKVEVDSPEDLAELESVSAPAMTRGGGEESRGRPLEAKYKSCNASCEKGYDSCSNNVNSAACERQLEACTKSCDCLQGARDKYPDCYQNAGGDPGAVDKCRSDFRDTQSDC